MSDHSAAHGHAADHKEHPTWKQYKWVAFWLTLITVIEVWVYYTPFQHSKFFPPTLLAMSVVKFYIVVMFYMHLRYDHWLFKRLFVGSLFIAVCTLFALLFLFGKLSF